MKAGSTFIDILETRRLLSASAQLTDGTLLVTGTNRADAIVISIDKADATVLDVRLNGHVSRFTLADVKKIQIDSLGGSDQIQVREANGPVFANALIYAGAGDDSITAGSGNDIIDGGTGNDSISGGNGDDVVYGGTGNDTIRGGADNDMIEGGAGADVLLGNSGDDNLDGGAGRDNVKVGTGDDSIAVDSSHSNELRGASVDDVQQYTVTEIGNIPAEVRDATESHVPNAHTVRVEQSGSNYTVYYHFGTDPALYKAVVSFDDGVNVELVGREVSLTEARPAAINAFAAATPNLGLVTLFQLPHEVYQIRYRAADGTIQSQSTTTLVWSQDNANDDQDNDGYSDGQESGGNPDDGGSGGNNH